MTDIKSNMLSLYTRAVSDAAGNKRIDENILGNFKITSWIKLEAGFRQGERPQHGDAYYHYKLELCTKYFYNKIRFILRLSDNVINYSPPSYRKTNELGIAEFRQPLTKHWQAKAGLGYLVAWQQDKPDLLPVHKGSNEAYPVFKLSIKYITNHKSSMELAYGSYDVFNPYKNTEPFAQITAEKKFTKSFTLFSYFRYEYDRYVFRPLNYFLSLGIKSDL